MPKEFNELPSYGDIGEKKPHLFTPDPYATGVAETPPGGADSGKFAAPPLGYSPPVGPYEDKHYHEPDTHYHVEPEYHEPEVGYNPPHIPHDEYNPHDDYSPHFPHYDDYSPHHNDYHDEYSPPPHYHEEPHDDYSPPPHDEYGPPSDSYGPPSDSYGPPKIKEPVLLAERPYEVKHIQAPPVVTVDTYTKFDCRNTPYPDRHYADTEAGCQVREY